MPLPKLAAFCVAIAFITAPASAEQVRVYVDIQQAISEAGMSAPTTEMLAPIETEAAAIESERETLEAELEAFTRDSLFMIGAQRANREKQLSTAASTLEQRQVDVDLARQDLGDTTRAKAKSALQSALEVYLGLNQVDTIKPFKSDNGLADFVILDSDYDITPTIAGLMRGADSNIVPPAPKAEAAMLYVNLDLAFDLASEQLDLGSGRQDFVDEINTQIEDLVAEHDELTRQLNSPVLSPNGRAALLQKRSETVAELETLTARSNEEMAEIEVEIQRELELAVREAIMNGETAGEADIVRLYRPEFDNPNAIFVANPDLDITADLVESMRETPEVEE